MRTLVSSVLVSLAALVTAFAFLGGGCKNERTSTSPTFPEDAASDAAPAPGNLRFIDMTATSGVAFTYD
ncbi:MAG TPA: hypothetical protein VFW87_26455, partial [Pirellulales bacterium]|nr:hypothetical protein [Pirellulales bacterium]